MSSDDGSSVQEVIAEPKQINCIPVLLQDENRLRHRHRSRECSRPLTGVLLKSSAVILISSRAISSDSLCRKDVGLTWISPSSWKLGPEAVDFCFFIMQSKR